MAPVNGRWSVVKQFFPFLLSSKRPNCSLPNLTLPLHRHTIQHWGIYRDTVVSWFPRMDIQRHFTLCLWKNRHTKQKTGRRAEVLLNYFCNLELSRIGSGPRINQNRDEDTSFTGLLFLLISKKKIKVNLYQQNVENKIFYIVNMQMCIWSVF